MVILCHSKLSSKDTTDSDRCVSYFDQHLEITNEIQLQLSWFVVNLMIFNFQLVIKRSYLI